MDLILLFVYTATVELALILVNTAIEEFTLKLMYTATKQKQQQQQKGGGGFRCIVKVELTLILVNTAMVVLMLILAYTAKRGSTLFGIQSRAAHVVKIGVYSNGFHAMVELTLILVYTAIFELSLRHWCIQQIRVPSSLVYGRGRAHAIKIGVYSNGFHVIAELTLIFVYAAIMEHTLRHWCIQQQQQKKGSTLFGIRSRSSSRYKDYTVYTAMDSLPWWSSR